jgi:hypothetical protein
MRLTEQAASMDDSDDERSVGNWTWRREDYVHVSTALNLLNAKLASWNSIAATHGATTAPYAQEVEKLSGMIEWGEERLADKDLHEVTVNGISIASLRIIKAALLHAAWHFDTETSEQAAQGRWPARVLDATRGRARRAYEMAEKFVLNRRRF